MRLSLTLSGLALWLVIATSCVLSHEGQLVAGVSDGGAGGSAPCVTPEDCPGRDGACGTRLCVDGVCQIDAAAARAPCAESGGYLCDGEGHCVGCVDESDCDIGECFDGMQLGGEICNVVKQCEALSAPLDCAPYVCGDGVCQSTCDMHAECADGFLCAGSGECVTSLPLGEPCAGPAECTSGNCADGVCCDALCDGTCESCAQAETGAADGSCSPVLAFTPDAGCPFALGCDDGADCAGCGFSLEPPGGNCPTACDSCDADTCNIVCDVDNDPACKGQTISCPPGWHCLIACTGNRACEGASFVCPDDYDCKVECASNQHKCENSVLNCSLTGSCHMDCQGGDTCNGASMICGDNNCTALCTGAGKPAMTCNDACGCAGTGC